MNKNIVEVPITFAFDHNKIIGYVTIEKKYASMFPEFCLAVGYIPGKGKKKNELLNFGLVRNRNV